MNMCSCMFLENLFFWFRLTRSQDRSARLSLLEDKQPGVCCDIMEGVDNGQAIVPWESDQPNVTASDEPEAFQPEDLMR